MKKAFEDNLPRVKPRVRFNAGVEEAVDGAPAAESADATDLRAAVQSAAEAALREPAASPPPPPVAPASPP